MTISDAAMVPAPVHTPRSTSVLGRSVGVATGRRLSVWLLAASLVAGIALFVLARRSAPATDTALAGRRYGPLLLPVMPMALPADPPVVDVAELGTLARLAERYGLLVLHWTHGDETTYVVRDETASYRYSTSGPGR